MNICKENSIIQFPGELFYLRTVLFLFMLLMMLCFRIMLNGRDEVSWFIKILSNGQRNYLMPDDFKPIVSASKLTYTSSYNSNFKCVVTSHF